MKSAERQCIAVIGLGRSGQGDDGIGPAVIRALRADFRPRADVRLIDADLSEIDVEILLAETCGVVMVGRVQTQGPPGAFKVLRGAAILPVARALSVSAHSATVLAPLARQELLDAVPAEAVLIAINGSQNRLADAMTPAVHMAAAPAVLAVELELARMGRPLSRLPRTHGFRDPWVRRPTRTELCGQ